MKLQNSDLNDMSWNDFIKAVSLMNLKSRGIKIEKRLIEKNNFNDSIRSEQGDAWLENGEGIEIKTSIKTVMKGSSFSLKGLRLWEDKVKHYIFVCIDISDLEKEPITHIMWVPKSYLLELEQSGKLQAPGDKGEVLAQKKLVQKMVTFKKGELELWVQKFPVPDWFKY